MDVGVQRMAGAGFEGFEIKQGSTKHQRNGDEVDQDPVDDEGEGALPEAGKLDTVELVQPPGFAGREVAHGFHLMGSPAVCYADFSCPRRIDVRRSSGG